MWSVNEHRFVFLTHTHIAEREHTSCSWGAAQTGAEVTVNSFVLAKWRVTAAGFYSVHSK